MDNMAFIKTDVSLISDMLSEHFQPFSSFSTQTKVLKIWSSFRIKNLVGDAKELFSGVFDF